MCELAFSIVMLRLLFVLGVFTLNRGQNEREDRVVNLDQGPVRGYLSAGRNYFEFYGVPYATAPKGDDKFKAPLEPPTWTETLEAVDDQIICPQGKSKYTMEGHAEEDCLIANIFVPKINDKHLPVLAYVHGGAFYIGSGNMVSQDLFLKHNVLVVNFNYRLGTQGFLCLGTKDIPGNAGMKDQVAALRWIKRNIEKFGGNPDDITIAGFSTGAASVELLMLSPMTKGLFNRAISESGSALSSWSINADPIDMAKRYIKDILYKNMDDLKDIEEFYKSLTIEQLTSKLYLTEPDSTFGNSACVEVVFEDQESFLNEAPLDILKSGKYNKVPYMAGFASEEGIFRIDLFDSWKDMMETNFSNFLPQDLVFENDIERNSIANKVKKFYFKDDTISESNIGAYVDYFTDVMFGYSIVRFARLHAQNSVPVYLYEYTYYNTEVNMPAHSDILKGAHAAQLAFLHTFGKLNEDLPSSEADILMQERLTKMWTNFAKYGVPIPDTTDLLPVPWSTMDPSRLNYLSMDVEMAGKDSLLGDRIKFWDNIYKEYYRSPKQSAVPLLHTEF